ncbi:DNA-directed RNA polymerase subunit delta [Companilactobacillus metriopterae]|uniref:DNA-directed RNA polymerase subunit delta n=1 Tax=Companilactobacillus metriopterae TaxID=1909267 RepID=UPI0030C814BE
MEFEKFKNQRKEELSLIEVALELLENNNKKVMNFSDMINEIQTYLGRSDDQIKEALPQFYTDLNNDGSFLSLGENVWGLRKWYPFDSIDEEVNHPEDSGAESAHKSASKVNAFLSDDLDDVVSFEDDSELGDGDDEVAVSGVVDNGPDLSKFTNADITAVDDVDDEDEKDDSLEDGIEGQLTEFDEDEEDIDLDEEDDDDNSDDDEDL